MPYKDIRKARKASRLRMRIVRTNKKAEQKCVTIDSLSSEVNMLDPDVKPNSCSKFLLPKPTFTAEQKLKYAKLGISV